jgi:hypothetical protein
MQTLHTCKEIQILVRCFRRHNKLAVAIQQVPTYPREKTGEEEKDIVYELNVRMK